MHNFQYANPSSLDEAVSLLAASPTPARILAGGTDLVVQMRVGQLKPELVIDGKSIPELNEFRLDHGAGLTLGAAVSCRRVWENKQIAEVYPALIDCSTLVGGVGIQGRATIGGNLCNSAPSADTIPALIALGAQATIRGAKGERSLAVEDFCTGPRQSALERDEILVSIRIPAPQANSGAFFLRFIPRNEMDIAVVNAAAAVALNESGDRFVSARIAIGAVAPTPLFVKAAGDVLATKAVSPESIAEACAIAVDAAKPINDMRGTIKQRKHLVGVLVKRALNGAIERARS